jgi:aminopeptidase N
MPELEAAYAATETSEPFVPDAVQAGQRALRGVLLRLLSADGSAESAARAFRHFESATNMTDAMAGLSVLSHFEAPERAAALAAFEAKWADTPLVMDKWMSVQAASKLPDALDAVKRLTAHPHFSMENPNRFRALVSAFANGNPLRFYDANGAGFRFVADQALAMDKVNPQVAARLFGVFESWRRFAPAIQSAMRTEIERVAKTGGLSKNLFEIATRALG